MFFLTPIQPKQPPQPKQPTQPKQSVQPKQPKQLQQLILSKSPSITLQAPWIFPTIFSSDRGPTRSDSMPEEISTQRHQPIDQQPIESERSGLGVPLNKEVWVVNSLSRLNISQINQIREVGKFIYRPTQPSSGGIAEDLEIRICATDAHGMMTLESVGKKQPTPIELAVLQRKLNSCYLSEFITASRTIGADYFDFPTDALGSTKSAEKLQLSTRLAECKEAIIRIFSEVNQSIRDQLDEQLSTLKRSWRQIEDDPESTYQSVELVLKQILVLKELTDNLNQARAKVAQHIKVRFLVARMAASTLTIDVLIDGLIATIQEPAGDSGKLLIGGTNAASRLIEQRAVEGFLMDRPPGQSKANISRIDDLLTHSMVCPEDRAKLIALLQSPDMTLAALTELVNALERNKEQATIAEDLRQGVYKALDSSDLTSGKKIAYFQRLESRTLKPEEIRLIQSELTSERLQEAAQRVDVLALRVKLKESISEFLSEQIYSGPFFDRGKNGKHKNGQSFYTPVTYLDVLELYRLSRMLGDPNRRWSQQRVDRYVSQALASMNNICAENRKYWRWGSLRYWSTYTTLKNDNGKEMSLAQYHTEARRQQLAKIAPLLDEVREKMEDSHRRIAVTQSKISKLAEKSKNFTLNSGNFFKAAAQLRNPPWYEFLKFWKW